MLVVKDFAASFLDAPISSSATTLTVLDASVLPDLTAPGSFCWFVLQSATDRSKIEIVRAISQVGKTYTVQRGWHTTPTAFAAGDYIEQRITVDTFAYYAEQIIAGLAEAGSGNLLRDGGPAYVAISDALSQLTASFTSHVNSNGVHAISAITGLQAALNTIVPSSEFETGAGKVMRVNGPRDQQISNALANTTGGAYVSASAPPSPFQGMRWFDITVGRTFIYYIDASNHGQWVEENPQSPDWITTAPVIAGIAQNTTMLSHRNLLINGDFSVNQRGVDTTINPAVQNEVFVSDRWIGWQGGNGSTRWRTYNVSNDTTNGNTIILGSRSALHIAPNTTDVGGFSIKQKIESRNIPYIWGKQCTLSFRLFTHQTGLECHMSVRACNTTDDFLNVTNIAVKSFSVPTGPAMDVSFPFTCPEAARNGMVVDIYFTAPSFIIGNGTGITNIQLELGEVATPFEHRPYSYELSLCQRYYQTPTVAYYGYNSQGRSMGGQFTFPVIMREAPSITLVSTEQIDNVQGSIHFTIVKDSGFSCHGNAATTGSVYFRIVTACDAEL